MNYLERYIPLIPLDHMTSENDCGVGSFDYLEYVEHRIDADGCNRYAIIFIYSLN